MTPDTLAIAFDGGVVVTGVANSTSGSSSPGAWAASAVAPAMPIEIVKLSPSGALTFAATYGRNTTAGPAPKFPCETPDFHGVHTNTTDLPLTSSAIKTTCVCANDSFDAWLAEFSADGSQLLTGPPSIIMFVGNWLSEYFTVWVAGT